MIRQFGIRLQFKQFKLSWLFHMHRQRIRLVVEEAIRSKCRADVHDEVVYWTMTWMHKISLAFKQLVNALDDISFPEHNLFFNRHEFVLHVRLEPCTRCIPWSKRVPKSSFLMYPLSAKTFPYGTLENTFHTRSSNKCYSRAFPEGVKFHELHHFQEHSWHQFHKAIVWNCVRKILS